MSSIPATTIGDPSLSPRIQSANSKEKEEIPTEKTSRPSSAAGTSRAPVIAATGADISPSAPAAEGEEPFLSIVISSKRPRSAIDTLNELQPEPAAENGYDNVTIPLSSTVQIDLILNPVVDSTSTESKTSRPPSANQRTNGLVSHGDATASTNSRPSSASHKFNEPSITSPVIATTNSRPSSANQKQNETTTVRTNSRPPSASLKTDESTTHGYTINSTSSRPPSANHKFNEPSTTSATIATANSRPSSASQKQNETTTVRSNSRPPSASLKTDELTTHGYSINSTTSILPLENGLVDQSTMSSNSRPSSANHKFDQLHTNSSIIAPISSRPSSAGQKTDITLVSDTLNVTATTNSRPPSASQQQEATASNDSASEKQNSTDLFNSNDLNTTQPIIGRPPSAIKEQTTAQPLSNENKPRESASPAPRIGSARKDSHVDKQ